MPTSSQHPETLKGHLDYFVSQGLKILQRPGIVPFLPSSRQDAQQCSVEKTEFVSQDTLFNCLFNSETAIPHMIGFYEDPFCHSTATFPCLPFIARSISLVLELRNGLHGFNGTVHGGLTCAIMDEAMGTLLFQNDLLNRQAKAEGFIPPDAKGFAAAATAHMDVKYRKPIRTPQIVVATASLERIEGRKMHMHVIVKDKDNQECASCDGVFISFPNSKL